MNWTQILDKAGIPDSPGRDQAVIAAHVRSVNRRAAATKPKQSKKSGHKK
jgi:hypothetical protein